MSAEVVYKMFWLFSKNQNVLIPEWKDLPEAVKASWIELAEWVQESEG